MKRLLCGEEILLKILMINSVGVLLISFVGDFNDKLRWGWITVAGDIEYVEDRSPAWGKKELRWDLSVATC